MARRNRFGTTGFKRKITNYSWSGNLQVATNAGGGASSLMSTLVLSNPNIDETLIRVVGMISVKTDQSIATENQEGAFGMILANDPAIAAGISSLPVPITDVSDDGWLLWVPFANHFEFKTAVGIDSQGSVTRYFDFKSKRVVQEGQAIVMVEQSTSPSNGYALSAFIRVLSMVRGT